MLPPCCSGAEFSSVKVNSDGCFSLAALRTYLLQFITLYSHRCQIRSLAPLYTTFLLFSSFILCSLCSEVPNLKPVQLRNEEILQRRIGAVTESECMPVLLYTAWCNGICSMYRKAEEVHKSRVHSSFVWISKISSFFLFITIL